MRRHNRSKPPKLCFRPMATTRAHAWALYGHSSEAIDWLERAQVADPCPARTRLTALTFLGENAAYPCDVGRAEAALQAGRALARALGARDDLAGLLVNLGLHLVDQRRDEEREEALAESLAVAGRTGDHEHESDGLAHGLTPRELEVVRLVGVGRSNTEIADALFISVPTVKRHLTNVFNKLALPSRSALTAYAHTHDLV